MKPFPNSRDDWIALVLFPFKVYVLFAYPFLVGCVAVRRCFEQPRFYYLLTVPRDEATYAVSKGYFLCLAVLLLGALVQALLCQRGRAMQTIGFFLLGCVAFWMFRPWGTIAG